ISVEGVGLRPEAARATVTVRGPRSVVASLRAEDLTLKLERGEDGAVRQRPGGPADIARQLEIVSISPKSLERPN
ncbi:hypothetical protein J0688_24775, partial [Vibrio parahaemolyticus]|uniref:hypothetical protein n=1 Tax=Vibrio parahaemolyticus TaxID=670 RepID=UPI001A8DA24E